MSFITKNKTKNRLFIITGIILMGISLWFFYSVLVISRPQEKFQEIKLRFYSIENRIKRNLELSNDSYLLRITYKTDTKQQVQFYFNGVKFTTNTFHYKRRRGDFDNIYIHLPKTIVKQGINSLEIIFPDDSQEYAKVLLRNYRKQLETGAYIVFSDSSQLLCGETAFSLHFFAGVVILLLGITTLRASENRLKKSFLLRRHLRLFILIIVFLSLITWAMNLLGYRIVVTKTFFWMLSTIGLAICFITILRKIITIRPKVMISFCFAEKKFSVKLGLSLAAIIILVNLCAYWPSFFHIFRHDEWFFFFSSKGEAANFQFIIKHIDWQLHLPYDRLNFRPVFMATLAINRVLFDSNYVGPHILAFVKHLIVTFLLWFIMWRKKKIWFSVFFALLFSVLITGSDCVMWPHVDAYITTTIILLLTLLVFDLFLESKVSLGPAFSIISVLVFFGMLTTQLFLVVPFVFAFYWFIINKTNKSRVKYESKSILPYLFVPLLLWGCCFLTHLYFAYPFNMTCQSDMVNLWKIIFNTIQFIIVILTANLYPFNTQVNLADKIYFSVTAFYPLTVLTLLGGFHLFRNNLVNHKKKGVLLLIMLFSSIVGLICLTRAAYIDSLLSSFSLPSYCAYPVNAILVLIIFYITDFGALKSYRETLLILALCVIVLNVMKVSNTAQNISNQTKPMKTYFNSVKDFIEVHKEEPDFSFKTIDRPPKTKIFPWYHQTCIDGLFNRFINNKDPKYLLEYDYDLQKLTYNTYDKRCQSIPSDPNREIQTKADFVNSIGIKLKKVSLGGKDILIGMFEVTQKQWQDVMGYNPSSFKNDYHPVENVSYYMAQQFVECLNKIEGENSYRLPTEEDYSSLVNLSENNIEKYGWLKYNSGGRTHPVGTMENHFEGVYDLIGNVWEWTVTPIHNRSPTSSFEGNPRLCFGASWRDDKIDYDNLITNYPPDFRHEHLGFRLVKESSTFKQRFFGR